METIHAEWLKGVLEDAQDVGLTYVAFELHPGVADLHPKHIYFFDRAGDAIQYAQTANEQRIPPGLGIA